MKHHPPRNEGDHNAKIFGNWKNVKLHNTRVAGWDTKPAHI